MTGRSTRRDNRKSGVCDSIVQYLTNEIPPALKKGELLENRGKDFIAEVELPESLLAKAKSELCRCFRLISYEAAQIATSDFTVSIDKALRKIIFRRAVAQKAA